MIDTDYERALDRATRARTWRAERTRALRNGAAHYDRYGRLLVCRVETLSVADDATLLHEIPSRPGRS